MTPRTDAKRGNVLIVVIWIISLLSLLIVSFNLDAVLQARINIYVRERIHVDHLTKCGEAIVEALLLNYKDVSAASNDSSARAEETQFEELKTDRWIREKRAIKAGSEASTGAVPVDPLHPEAGTVTVIIKPLEAKWNINNLYPGGDSNYDKIWQSILTSMGVPEEHWDVIVDSWCDWRDTDASVTGNDGAEDEYYRDNYADEDDERSEEELEALKAAAKDKSSIAMPRNNEIPDIKELSLIKFFRSHPALLEGGILNPSAKPEDQIVITNGLYKFMDVFGNGKINVNAADDTVLLSVPGIDNDPEIVGAILESRVETPQSAKDDSKFDDENGPFTGWSDLTDRTKGTIQDDAQNYLSYQPESYFEITIIGRSMGITHTVRAIAMIADSKVCYIRWSEDP